MLLKFYLGVQLLFVLATGFGGEGGGFRNIGLKWHNLYRASVGASPLELDFELSKVAHAHAERLANEKSITPSGSGYRENLWAYRGELRPLAKDLEYAIKCWYTGSTVPGNIVGYSVDEFALKNNTVRYVGFGVGTTQSDAEGLHGFTVVVAEYSELLLDGNNPENLKRLHMLL